MVVFQQLLCVSFRWLLIQLLFKKKGYLHTTFPRGILFSRFIVNNRDVLRTQSKSTMKQLTKSRELFSPKSSIIDIPLGSKTSLNTTICLRLVEINSYYLILILFIDNFLSPVFSPTYKVWRILHHLSKWRVQSK